MAHPVRKKDGQLTSSESERQARWQDHFKEVFRGASVSMTDLAALPLQPPLDDNCAMNVADTERAWMRLGRNKGVGRDGIPAEFLQATAAVSPPIATDLYNEVIANERWPMQWTGGRMQDIFKNKGERAESDDSCSRITSLRG